MVSVAQAVEQVSGGQEKTEVQAVSLAPPRESIRDFKLIMAPQGAAVAVGVTVEGVMAAPRSA